MEKERVIRRKYSNLPPFEKRPLLDITRNYIENFREIQRSSKNWILFSGRSGSGKTTQAYMITDAVLNLRTPVNVKIYQYSDMVRELTALRFDSLRYEEQLNSILDRELLVFDDFLDVVPKQESFEEQIVLDLIKKRYLQRKPLVITMELTPKLLKDAIPRHSEAIIGRIYEMCNGRIDIANSDAVNYRFSMPK